MQVIHLRYPLDQNITYSAAVLAIGTFDGVHVGHREVLGRAMQLSAKLHVSSAAMTFDPHPREVLGRKTDGEYLTPLAEKLRQFEQCGLDIAYVVHFDQQLAQLAPRDFVERFLIPLQVKGIVVGYNYAFGHKASGTTEDLIHLGQGRYEVDIVQPVQLKAQHVSSTTIRELLKQGDMGRAADLLGRPYAVDGEVVHGKGRGGKLLGFPTANLQLCGSYAVPRVGVYIVRVDTLSGTRYGAMSIGFNPTFDDQMPVPSLEVHLLDVDEDLYGQTLRIHFLHYLRPEKKFNDVSELIAQMQKDVADTRAWGEREQAQLKG
ncbi:bifunctional riboflavin kinase/FAD synthetase [Numidum massiliense]|uniref:bifunctional riboflavin kinase/FAD synthetase n=1 Tax=Numidum massiliense TaxID=1522315 RepID=UPI0006D5AAD7|nr:bifunctional riboflavin kinase/FAD synthetase [Numidum massiliense]